jgi:hypothetical protein
VASTWGARRGLWYTRGSSRGAAVGSSVLFLGSRGNAVEPSSRCTDWMHFRDAALNSIKRHFMVANLITSRLDTIGIPKRVHAIEEFLVLGE